MEAQVHTSLVIIIELLVAVIAALIYFAHRMAADHDEIKDMHAATLSQAISAKVHAADAAEVVTRNESKIDGVQATLDGQSAHALPAQHHKE